MFIIVYDVRDFLLCRASQFVNDPSTAAQLIQLLLPFLLNQSEKYKVCKIFITLRESGAFSGCYNDMQKYEEDVLMAVVNLTGLVEKFTDFYRYS